MENNINNYIEESRKAGYSDQQIIDQLIQSGWSQQQVDGLGIFNQSKKQPNQSSTQKNILIILVIVIAAIAVGAVAYLYFVKEGITDPIINEPVIQVSCEYITDQVQCSNRLDCVSESSCDCATYNEFAAKCDLTKISCSCTVETSVFDYCEEVDCSEVKEILTIDSSELTTYINNEYKYSIDLPESWVLVDTYGGAPVALQDVFDSGEDTMFIAANDSDEAMTQGVLLASAEIEDVADEFGKTMTLDEFVDLWLRDLVSWNENDNPPVVTDIFLKNGVRGKQIINDSAIILSEEEGGRYMYIFINEDYLYALAFLVKDDLHTSILNSLDFIQ